MYRTFILIPMLLLALNGNEEAIYLNFIGLALILLFIAWGKYTKRGKMYVKSMYKALYVFNSRVESFLNKVSK